MFTYKFFVDQNRKNTLRLRIVNNRKKAELSLGIFMTPKELENVLSDSRNDKLIQHRRFITNLRGRLENLKMELIERGMTDLDANSIKSIINESILNKTPEEQINNTKLFAPFFKKFALSKSNRGYRESIENTFSRIQAYDTNFSTRKFEEINLKWLHGFEEYLIDIGSSTNTRAIHFRNIRTAVNRAIDDELMTSYPFRRFKIKTEATVKRSLTVEELRELFQTEGDSVDSYYIDIFKLMFMLVGINTVDLFGLTEISPAGRIEYRRAKTHKLYSIKVEPEAAEIINRYRGTDHLLDFADRWKDHRNFIRQMNEILQNIGGVKNKGGRLEGGEPKKTTQKKKKGKWPNLTTYWARHSWATIAYSLDVPKDVISQALGHSSGNSVTEIYIARDIRKVDEANRRVLDWVLYGKM